ncbi:CPBP family intramembrane glutamic endopeptidase [Halorubrum vacuolatum]|nr:CPBP family intramembrane glutamic endopeptidase [Halorubrum vacuolatum]
MTDWTLFAVGVVVLTLVLLILTRRSSEALEGAHIVGVDDPRAGTDRDGDGDDSAEGDVADPVPVEPSPTPTLTADLLLINVAVTQGIALAALVALAWWADVPAAAFGLSMDDLAAGVLLAGVALGVLFYTGNEIAAGIGRRVGMPVSERLREAMAPDDARGWTFLLVVVLPVIALFEEALFRGALIGAFALGFGVDPWLLAVASSILFGLGHGAQGRLGVLVTGVLGFALAAVFVLTESLLLVIVVHYVINALEFGVREGLGWKPFGGVA